MVYAFHLVKLFKRKKKFSKLFRKQDLIAVTGAFILLACLTTQIEFQFFL